MLRPIAPRSGSTKRRAKNAASASVICSQFEQYILTHQLTPAGPIPSVFDPDGVYPYESYCETSRRPVLKRYRFVNLRNAHISVTICPDLGGKVTSMVHVPSSKEVLYKPAVIRHTRILPRSYFVAGGIEVSFPISHSPSQNEAVDCKIDSGQDRLYVTCGERELHFGMRWSVEYSLGNDDHFLTQRTVFHNPGTQAYPWMSWSNAAVPSAADTKFHFPKGEVLSHSSKMQTLDWERQGPTCESDIEEMTGLFWKTSDVNAFGVYTPSLGCGLYHVADKTSAPGIKLWSYGNALDKEWSMLSTERRQPYIEIQGGPIEDQSIKLMLEPNEVRSHIEFWLPTDAALDIRALRTPAVELRSLRGVPLFSWTRTRCVKPWLDLIRSFRKGAMPPRPPAIHDNLWAPSGIEDLSRAFAWAIKNASSEHAQLWRFYRGTWLAGRGDDEAAIKSLSSCRLGIAKIVLARLLHVRGDLQAARLAYAEVADEWLLLHPQVVAERDRLLRKCGTDTLTERDQWLSQVDALEDEAIVERRVQLLIDKNELHQAKELLLSIDFQKVHQTYHRTELWRQLSEKLGFPLLPIPDQLGEDRLARFGAYREYE